jgi:hypothetical protein
MGTCTDPWWWLSMDYVGLLNYTFSTHLALWMINGSGKPKYLGWGGTLPPSAILSTANPTWTLVYRTIGAVGIISPPPPSPWLHEDMANYITSCTSPLHQHPCWNYTVNQPPDFALRTLTTAISPTKKKYWLIIYLFGVGGSVATSWKFAGSFPDEVN